MTDRLSPPLRYEPSMEQEEEGEAETSRELNETFRDILETTSKDYGRAVRSVHAKAHGVIEGTLTVDEGLPPELAQGLFARAGSYEAILRFSTNPGDILDDSISVPRGLAIKLLGVEGARLEGSEGDSTQDFIMVDGPAFAAPKGKAFLANLKMLAKTTDKAEWAKKALSAVLQGTEAALETVGAESATVKQMGGAPNLHPLGRTYYSQSPFLYGDYVAKFQVAPVSPNFAALAEQKVNASGRPDALREEIAEVMAEGPGVWELRVQLLRDREKMPVEDSSIPWPEEDSPYIRVGEIRAAAQPSWTHDRDLAQENLRYSVWTGLAAHRPLGSINRLRKPAYQMSADFRGQFNGCPIHEPREVPEGLR